MNDISSSEYLQDSQPTRHSNLINYGANEDDLRLDVTAAHFSYGSHAVLRGVDLKLMAGEIYGLLGPNGAGKTTLMKAMYGRLRLDSGFIRVAGKDPRVDPQARRMISYVPQDIAIFPYLTVTENLEIFGRISELSKKDIDQSISFILQKASLENQAHKLCRTLSGGYQRRINICAAILNNPLALILDEPTVGIDINAREEIHHLLLTLRERGAAILIATHDLDQAQQLADRVGFMMNGQIWMEGAPNTLIKNYFGDEREIIISFSSPPSESAIQLLREFGFQSVQAPLIWVGQIENRHIDISSLSESFARSGMLVKEIGIRSPDLTSLFMRMMNERVI
ncbi:MAG: ABC transporter ATP-binding protein [Methylocystis sp.]